MLVLNLKVQIGRVCNDNSITFFVDSKYLLPGIKASSKTYIQGSKS